MESPSKKAKIDIFDIPGISSTRSAAEIAAAYKEAVRGHPFFDNAHSVADLYADATVRDGEGNILAVVLRNVIPPFAATMAAEVLRPAATRSSLRATIYGGESPQSGIAGYFDYRGTPIAHKNRKTAFTYEHAAEWSGVFPVVDYVSQIYKCVAPDRWEKQDAAIPDLVRIHGSPYSTLTINSKFRTATHTDAGDFDAGFSCIACLEGEFKGLALSFDNFGTNVLLQPRDVMIFDSHHFHSNTEVESLDSADVWSRLSCVFYYRAALGDTSSYADYKRRLKAARQLLKGETKEEIKKDEAEDYPIKIEEGEEGPASPVKPARAPEWVMDSLVVKPNGQNLNRPSRVHPFAPSPFAIIAALHAMQNSVSAALRVHAALTTAPSTKQHLTLAMALFGEELDTKDGIPLRELREKVTAILNLPPRGAASSGGFRENTAAIQSASEREQGLSSAYLADHLSVDLLYLWEEARERWLDLVKADWAVMVERCPDRTAFTWNNRGTMNAAFFDLCDVAKQVCLALLHKEVVEPEESVAFWTVFALHLHRACIEELQMPEEAMSLTKLNVKLKDYSFGGTRYYKDMPEEERRRRDERQERLVLARQSVKPTEFMMDEEAPREWQTNDSFDYQSEDRVVNYKKAGWPQPEDLAAKVTSTATAAMKAYPALMASLEKSTGPAKQAVKVLVLLPRPTLDSQEEHAEVTLPEGQAVQTEWTRLMKGAGVRRALNATQRNDPKPAPYVTDAGSGKGKSTVEVTFSYGDEAPSSRAFDFVILQHCLAAIGDDESARSCVCRIAQQYEKAGCVLVVESEVQDRQYYTLQKDIREASETVYPIFLTHMLRRCYGLASPHLRTRTAMTEMFGGACGALYKFPGSPLNSLVILCDAEKLREEC